MVDANAVTAEERLFSLVLALIATPSGLTKDEILSTVQGYRAEWAASSDHATLERKFERDKNGLRELGVPVETVEDVVDPQNNQILRYRIPRAAYDLPSDVTFSPKEIAMLNLAAMAWQEGSLSAESRRALLKLASLGVAAEEPLIGYAPRIRARDRAFEPLSAAVMDRAVVRFSYLKPGASEAEQRLAQPLALVQHRGRWHVYAMDLDREATRTFLMSRIVGKVERAPVKGQDYGSGHHAQALAELDELWLSNHATLKVEPGSDAALRLGRQAATVQGDVIDLHYTDTAVLADELAGFGPEVEVLGPPRLRDAVQQRLRIVAEMHSGVARAASEAAARETGAEAATDG